MENGSIKLLVAAGLYPPDIGGPATYAKMLEEELPKHNIELTVLPFGEVRKYPKLLRHLVYAWRLWRHAKAVDIIYALDPISVGVPALLVSRLSGTPYLVRLGGDYAWEQGQQRFSLKLNLDEYTKNRQVAPRPVKILSWLQTSVVKRAHKVILPSEYLKRIVASWNKTSDNLVRIYSVLHPLVVTETREELRSKLKYTNPTIVSAARLVPWKGMSALLEVAINLKPEYPEINLIIIGDGPEKVALEKEAAELGITNHVRFTGSLAKDALGGVIKAADVFVLNTAYEGLSHQLLEVMDLEIPVVTTEVGGNPELVENEISGLLVDFDDTEALTEAIVKLISNEPLRQKLTVQAKVKTKNFNKTSVTKQLVEVLRSVTN